MPRSFEVLVCVCMCVCANSHHLSDAKVEGAKKVISAFVKKYRRGRNFVNHCCCVRRKEAGSLCGCIWLLIRYTVLGARARGREREGALAGVIW